MSQRVQFDRLAALRQGWVPENYSDRLVIPDTRIAVASDVHVPLHDEELLAQMMEQCVVEKIEAVVWLGDFMDMPKFSSYGPQDIGLSFTRELEIAKGIITIMSEYVHTQYWSRGNHEERWMKKLQGQVYMDQLARMAGLGDMVDSGRLILSDNPTLDAFDGAWMLTHPKEYGAKPLDLPAKLAEKYQQNIMSAHSHHFGKGTRGRFTIVETGGMFKTEYHQFVQHNVTSLQAWHQGYWFLIDGQPSGYQLTPVRAQEDAWLLET